jgi:protein-disulfide isomerase
MAAQGRKVNWFAIWVSVGVVVALVVVAVLVITLNNASKATPTATGSQTPTASNINSDTGAILVGTGSQTMDTYIDFMCPICNQFEQFYGSQIKSLVDDGTITLRVHPISILDRSSQGTQYSTRAASAAYCVAIAKPDAVLPFIKEMYAQQPAEGSTGLTDSQILDIAKSVGVTGIDDCVNSGRYMNYVTAMTEKTPIQPGLSTISTPTIAINGTTIANSTLPQDLSTLFTGSSTPSPTATP